MYFDLMKKKRLCKSENKVFWERNYIFLDVSITCYIFNRCHFSNVSMSKKAKVA
jgi:hypothetical protein